MSGGDDGFFRELAATITPQQPYHRDDDGSDPFFAELQANATARLSDPTALTQGRKPGGASASPPDEFWSTLSLNGRGAAMLPASAREARYVPVQAPQAEPSPYPVLLPGTAWATHDNTEDFWVDLAANSVEDVVGPLNSASARGNSSSSQWWEGETPNANIPTIAVEPSVQSSQPPVANSVLSALTAWITPQKPPTDQPNPKK